MSYKTLNNTSYSASRGAALGDLSVPRSRTTRHRCFAVSGPTLWNSLLLTIHDPSLTHTQFCARLKTVLIMIIFIRRQARNSIQNIKELKTIKLSLKQYVDRYIEYEPTDVKLNKRLV